MRGFDIVFYLINAAVTLLIGVGLFAYWVSRRKRLAAETVGRAQEQAERILRDAEREAETRKKEALLEAKERAHDLRTEADAQLRDRRQQLAELEQTLARRETAITERLKTTDQIDRDLKGRERVIAERENATAAAASKYEQLVRDQQRELERVASLTGEEAKELLLKQIEAEAKRDAANLVKRLDAEARETAVERAKHYITEAIQRSAAEHAIETTVSVVDLPSDELKGRIIGREGRNIRALEIATGVDLIVDDTPGAIILSGFDPYRREVAKQAIERLIADGRIHPARIEEVVDKVKAEMEDAVRKEGQAAAFELGLHDLHPEIHRLMGRLKFRTSYGQNVLNHSGEVARLAGIMAREIGLDAHVAVRAAFLHDIGKAIDREMQGTHLELGIDFLRKHGENEAVIGAMAAHHMDIDWPSLEAMIVQAADAISAARPGARRDILESYVKRLEKLEGIADSFKGVSKAFALQAGREIRIMVESEKISDEEAIWLSKDIARRIENELEYPGQIKVTVIRETRAVEYAK
jgi:ribonuclease Y